jgi:hypothetical protein
MKAVLKVLKKRRRAHVWALKHTDKEEKGHSERFAGPQRGQCRCI